MHKRVKHVKEVQPGPFLAKAERAGLGLGGQQSTSGELQHGSPSIILGGRGAGGTFFRGLLYAQGAPDQVAKYDVITGP